MTTCERRPTGAPSESLAETRSTVPPTADNGTRDTDGWDEAVVIEPLDEPSARRLTNRIKLLTGSVRESLDKLAGLVVEARDGQAHVALGYKSWTAYVAAEIGDQPLRLDREDRRELVASLADAGMPTRAIVPFAGTSQSTVVADLAAGEQNRSPDRGITGRDGKTYPVTSRPVEDHQPKPRRSSLPDSYRNAIYKLEKALESLERLHADDRFLGHRADLHDRHWRTTSDLQALMMTIDGDLSSPTECDDCGARVLPNRDLGTRCGECR